MSTITREFTKEQLIERCKEAIASLKPCVGIAETKSLACFEIALASLEAEPAYFINRVKHSDAYGDDVELRTYCYELDALKSKEDFGGEIVPVYTAPPSPVSVPAAMEMDDDFDSAFEHGKAVGWNACRAAMLQGARNHPEDKLAMVEPVTTAYKLPANTPCRDAPEHIWLQTAGVWPEDGEFSELTWCSDNQHQDDTLYVRADVVSGNSPVIPDGWVMVPVEPTAEMLEAGDEQFGTYDVYRRMIAAAPQQEVKP